MSAVAMPRPAHVLTASQFDRELTDSLLQRAAELEGIRDNLLAGKIMATLFYEPSTRTRLSFESAMVRRGGEIISAEDASQTSSAVKGETLEDTIRVVGCYADLIVLRHPTVGASQRAALVSPVPLINAGDGSGEHPTQALLDIYTIKRELGSIDGKHIVLCGDLRFSRTVPSLVTLASLYNARFSLVSTPELAMAPEMVEALRNSGTHIVETADINEVIRDCDVLYPTRVQEERTDIRYNAGVVVDNALMQRLPERAIVMSPLPRRDEIAPEIDNDPRVAYFRQAANGVPVRMALLEALLT
jgi:aspartate carbamoyltransferase catalytic subunit